MFLSLPKQFSNFYLDKEEDSFSLQPTADVYEEKDQFLIKVSLPGLDKKDVKVEVEDNQLIVKGEKKETVKKNDDYYSKVESHFGSFERRWELGRNIDFKSIKANHSNGVLTLNIKKTESSQNKQIPISGE